MIYLTSTSVLVRCDVPAEVTVLHRDVDVVLIDICKPPEKQDKQVRRLVIG